MFVLNGQIDGDIFIVGIFDDVEKAMKAHKELPEDDYIPSYYIEEYVLNEVTPCKHIAYYDEVLSAWIFV